MRVGPFASALAALVLTFGYAWPAAAETPRPVRLDTGLVQGVRQGEVIVYKGLPFAAPPTGELRWRPPQPAKRWTGVKVADADAPGCIQAPPEGPAPGRQGTYAEDCLYLNVWRPADAKGPLPVMVWFYGGGFTSGDAAWDLFDGSALARHGVMVVDFNYRLGALGFLALPELTRESGHNASGNYALMDAIAALRWVQRNAAALGGDPRRVTVFGQSAGAQIISALLVSPETRGLFARAIGESSALMTEADARAPGGIASLAKAEAAGAAFAAKLGAPTLAELRRLPAERFQASPPGTGPIVDGWIVPQAPRDAFAAGRQWDVPTLVGSNAQEVNFPAPFPDTTAAKFKAELATGWGPFGDRLFAAYPFATDEEAWRASVDLYTDLSARWQVWTWARLQARTGRAPVFYYHFEQREPLKDKALAAKVGTPHASEMMFLFQNERQPGWDWSPQDRAIADQMARYWTNFARTGDPNGPGLPAWPRFTEQGRQAMHLKTDPAAGPVPGWSRLELIDQMISTFH
jgi:para-nitrobenzyl esterase